MTDRCGIHNRLLHIEFVKLAAVDVLYTFISQCQSFFLSFSTLTVFDQQIQVMQTLTLQQKKENTRRP